MYKGFVILFVFELCNYVKKLDKSRFHKVLGACVGIGHCFDTVDPTSPSVQKIVKHTLKILRR